MTPHGVKSVSIELRARYCAALAEIGVVMARGLTARSALFHQASSLVTADRAAMQFADIDQLITPPAHDLE